MMATSQTITVNESDATDDYPGHAGAGHDPRQSWSQPLNDPQTMMIDEGGQNVSPVQEVPEIKKRTSTIIVVASFTIIFTCCGINFAFGVFQALFEALAAQPNTPFTGATAAEISLIGTFSISLMTMGGPFVVAWAKRFSPRRVSFVGGFIFGLSLILASFCTALWQFILTQGVLLGLGTCLSYMVSVTVAPAWFTARRGLAMGIILSGTGVGGLVWAPVLKICIDALGFRNTLRLTGGVSFLLVTLASGAIDWEPVTKAQISIQNSTRSSRASGIFNVPLADWRIVRSRKFATQALASIFQAAAYYVPVFFFASYARSLGYSDTAGANFVAISNACNAIGKIVIGHLADRFGRLNTLFLTTLVSGLVTLGLWLPSTMLTDGSTSRNLFIAFTVLYGIFASAYVSLFPTSLMELFGTQNFASVNGALYMIRGCATIFGTPMGAVITSNSAAVEAGPHDYLGMSSLVGALMLAAAAAVLWGRIEAMKDPSGKHSWKLKM